MSLAERADYVPPAHVAFTRGTRHAEQKMATQINHGYAIWEEEHITHELCEKMFPEVRYAKFNRPQEKRIGADYIWWWVDRSGQSFGCLIQAKSLKRVGRKWKVGSDAPLKLEQQLTLLLRSADHLGVPAGLMLYAGDADYRSAMSCPSWHRETPCHLRKGAGVTLLPALPVRDETKDEAIAATRQRHLPGGPNAMSVFHQATPIISLTDPNAPETPFSELALSGIRKELRPFLEVDQIGAPRIARTMFSMLGRYHGHEPDFLYDGPHRMHTLGPRTRNYFSSEFVRHIQRGLRPQLPDYVRACLNGDPPTGITHHAAGIVLVEL